MREIERVVPHVEISAEQRKQEEKQGWYLLTKEQLPPGVTYRRIIGVRPKKPDGRAPSWNRTIPLVE